MDKIVLKATKREVIGKHVKSLRREGKLPAVIYGKSVKPLSIFLDLHDTTLQLRYASRASVITIDVEGEKFNALLRERQRDVLTGKYLHIDFLAVSMTETVRTEVNIHIEGKSPAVDMYNAMVINNLDRIEVEALPGDLPEAIVVDVTGLTEIGAHILVKDLVMPSGVECLSDPEETVVVVAAPEAEEVEEVVEELEAEPEVIEKGKLEEEE